MRQISKASVDVTNDEFCKKNICSNHWNDSMNVDEANAYVQKIDN